jgi:hypothetical protein
MQVGYFQQFFSKEKPTGGMASIQMPVAPQGVLS